MVTRLEETRQKQRFEQPGQRAERVALQLGKYLFLNIFINGSPETKLEFGIREFRHLVEAQQSPFPKPCPEIMQC